MTAMLTVSDLCVGYGPVAVLRSVSFEVGRGETFAIIGPNGAGKTTLFKAVTGEVPVTSGMIRMQDTDITRMPVHLRARAGLGRTFQVARVFEGLSVLDNVIASIELRLRAAGLACGAWYAWRPSRAVLEGAEHLLTDLGLASVRHMDARFLSHGDKKRLEIAVALAQEPRILMLDEPTAGMSHADRVGVVDLIRRLRQDKGVTVVMTEHDMDVIFGLADRIMVMNYGQMIATGAPADVRSSPLVREVYLGKEMVDA
jgi:branched-chain amino acid transport system ATP-binding protein